jgi:hypothetical protein
MIVVEQDTLLVLKLIAREVSVVEATISIPVPLILPYSRLPDSGLSFGEILFVDGF